MKQIIKKGTVNKTFLIFIQDSSATTGVGLTGVTASMLSAICMRVEDDNDVTITPLVLVDLVGTGTDHYESGIEEISGAAPGWYRFDAPDACFATGADAVGFSIIDAAANDVAPITIEIQLVDVDLYDATRFGLTALPNAAADAGGGLVISDLGGLDADAMATGVTAIEVDTVDIQGRLPAALVGGLMSSDITAISTDTTAANNLELMYDGTGYAGGTAKLGVDVVQVSGDATSADNLELDYDGTGYAKANSTIGTTTTNTDMVGTDSAALASVCTEGRLAELDSGNLPTTTDNILTDTGTTLDNHLTDIKGTSFVKDTHSLIDIETYVDILDDGTSGNVKIATDVAATLVDTAVIGALGAGLTDLGGMSTAMKAEVNTEVDGSMVTYGLDHLVSASVTGTDIVDDSIIASMVSKEATADWDDFVNTTDSLQALRDNQSGATAGAIADAVWDEAQSGHTSVGTFGIIATEIASILVDTGTTLDNHLTDIKGTSFVKDTHSLIDIETYVDILDDGTSGNAKIATDVAAVLVDTATTIPGTITTLQTDSTLIVADTNELQTDWTNAGRLDVILDAILVDTAQLGAAVGASISADIAAVKAETVLIVADTNELQTDWANDGRLDVIQDAILVDTAEIGAAGAGLTAIFTTAQTESYASDGSAFTPAQALYMIWSSIQEFTIISTTLSSKKLDSTEAMTWTLDDASDPTSRARAT